MWVWHCLHCLCVMKKPDFKQPRLCFFSTSNNLVIIEVTRAGTTHKYIQFQFAQHAGLCINSCALLSSLFSLLSSLCSLLSSLFSLFTSPPDLLSIDNLFIQVHCRVNVFYIVVYSSSSHCFTSMCP